MKDEMTPKERIGAFLAGDAIDRTPCVPLILNHAARLIGESIKSYGTDGAVMGAAHVAAYRRYGQDLITIFTDTSVTGEAMGSRLHFPDDDVSRLKTPAVIEPEDVDSLVVPDATTAGRLPVLLEAVRRCVDEVGEEVFVSVCIPAPFSTAAAVRSTAMLARDLYKRPELAKKLLDLSTLLVIDFCRAVADAGGIPALVDPVASGSVLGRKTFEEFALPGLKAVLGEIRKMGFPTILHICGRTSGIIDLMADAGAMVLSIDEIELSEAKEKVGERACLMGNVSPTAMILEGTPEMVRSAARKCLEDAGDSPGGFILSTGCEVPIEAPVENVDALMAVARESRLS